MKRIILLFLFVKFCFAGFSQVIKGTILDKNSAAPVSYATVYFNGTSVGTRSDENGYFEIDATRHISMPLTISALGYYSVTLEDYVTSSFRVFYLEPKVYTLKEVIVKADRKAARKAKRYYAIFTGQFLGQSRNASECEIKNDLDIRLTYDKKKGILRASAFEPVLIKNKALGYDITYFLDKFEYNLSNYSIIILGNYLFAEDSVLTKSQKEDIEKRRETTYLGSRMHFFKSLWENKLDSEGYKVFDSETNTYFKYDDLVIQPDTNSKYLKFNKKVTVQFKNMKYGTIELSKEKAFFDKDGYFDPIGINWGGEMSKQRVGDLLPFGFKK